MSTTMSDPEIGNHQLSSGKSILSSGSLLHNFALLGREGGCGYRTHAFLRSKV